jgi:S1-C subfamily serine protease
VVVAVLLSASAVAAQAPPEPPQRRVQIERSGDAWLGIWLGDAVDGGVQVLAVVPGGPADKAGLEAGDLIIEGNEEPVGNDKDLSGVLRVLSPGDGLALGVLRAGERLELQARLGQRGRRSRAWTLPDVPAPAEVPAAAAPPSSTYRYFFRYQPTLSLESAGLRVTEITPALRIHYGAPEDAGVLVTRVEPGRPAAGAGFEVGDVLVRIGEKEIRNERQIQANLVGWDTREPLLAYVIRANQLEKLTVVIERAEEAPEKIALGSSDTDNEAQRAMLRKRMQMEIERLERRLDELRREVEALERDR